MPPDEWERGRMGDGENRMDDGETGRVGDPLHVSRELCSRRSGEGSIGRHVSCWEGALLPTILVSMHSLGRDCRALDSRVRGNDNGKRFADEVFISLSGSLEKNFYVLFLCLLCDYVFK